MSHITSNPPIGVIGTLNGTEEVLVLQNGVLKRDSSVVRKSTDASGNTVLVGVGVDIILPRLAGELHLKIPTYQELLTGVQTHVLFDDVIRDDLGVYNATTHLIEVPDDVVKLDYNSSIELASTASGYGNTTGHRALTLNNYGGSPIIGMPSVSILPASSGSGIIQASGFSVDMNLTDYPNTDGGIYRQVYPRIFQDSGITIRIGDYSGTGVAQTFLKMKFYK